MSKIKMAQDILSKLSQTIDGITDDLNRKLSLHIEYGQAIKWLEILCNCLFEYTQPSTYNIEFKDLDCFEKYLRLQIYKALRNNTVKWEKQQKEKLDKLKTNLRLSFQKILTDFSNESISKEIIKYILIAFEQQREAKEKSIDQRLQTYLKKGWTDTYTATNYAYSKSFDALNINAIREYLEDPTQYMTNLFNADYAIYSEILVESILREIDENFINTKEGLLKAISEWNALFDSTCKYDQLPLSAFFTYLSGPFEYNSLRMFIKSKYNINMKESLPAYDFSELLIDVNNLLGSITVDNPVDFCESLCNALIEGLTNMQTTWVNMGRSKTKERLQAQLTTKNILMSSWNQLGCSARCPLCSSKCELPDDGHNHHQVTKHFLPAFVGFHNVKTNHPSLIICTEDMAHDIIRWAYSRDSEYLPLTQFLRNYHPSWLPFPRSEPSDEHITKMRAVWWKLKDELCEKYNMIDNTDPSWGSRYGSLVPE